MLDYTDGANRWARTPSRLTGGISNYGMTYPSPFFDIAHTYLPETIKQMFVWCRFFTLTTPLISATTAKLSEYPVTDVVVEHENDNVTELWTKFFEDSFRLRPFLLDVGMYFHVYGNCIVSLYYPSIKFLKCKKCGHSDPIKRCEYKFQDFKFILTCKHCGERSESEVFEVFIRSPELIRPIIWNPEDIDIKHNDVTGEDVYYYTLPTYLKNDITIGKPSVIESVPQLFLDAVKQQKSIILSKDNVFHFKRSSILNSGRDRGWGIPLILPVLKDVFHLQLIKKANETIAIERVYPLNIIFPQAGSETSDPFSTISLTQWRDQVANEISRWRQDRAYIPIMPLPVGQQLVSGDGRSMLMYQEERMIMEQIIAGMGVPQEFIFGGLQYSGSNVSLRMLENFFLRYVTDLLLMIRTFIIPNISSFLGWPKADVRFKPFKMADDLQLKAFHLQLNQMGMLSETSLLSGSDFNPIKETEMIRKETKRKMESQKEQQLIQAAIQGEAQLVMAKYQAKAQAVSMEEQMQAQAGMQQSAQGEAREGIGGPQLPMPMEPLEQQEGGAVTPQIAAEVAQQLRQAPQDMQQALLGQIQQQNPQLADAVRQQLQHPPGNGLDTKPLPEVLPPRRSPETAQV